MARGVTASWVNHGREPQDVIRLPGTQPGDLGCRFPAGGAGARLAGLYECSGPQDKLTNVPVSVVSHIDTLNVLYRVSHQGTAFHGPVRHMPLFRLVDGRPFPLAVIRRPHGCGGHLCQRFGCVRQAKQSHHPLTKSASSLKMRKGGQIDVAQGTNVLREMCKGDCYGSGATIGVQRACSFPCPSAAMWLCSHERIRAPGPRLCCGAVGATSGITLSAHSGCGIWGRR